VLQCDGFNNSPPLFYKSDGTDILYNVLLIINRPGHRIYAIRSPKEPTIFIDDSFGGSLHKKVAQVLIKRYVSLKIIKL